MKQNGTQKEPIDISDDDEAQQKKRQKIEFQVTRQRLCRAHLGSQFDVLVQVIKSQMKGSDQQKQKILMHRFYKYFRDGVRQLNLAKNQYFRERREPKYLDQSVVPVDRQLILYGIDLLSSREIKKKFTGINIKVKNLDDSHCKIIFQNGNDAIKGLQMNLQSKSEGMLKLQNQDFELPRGWFPFQPYQYLTYQRKLQARYAASNQNDAQIAKSNDYYMYQDAKKQFEKTVKEEVTKIRYLETMRKFKLIDDCMARERLHRRRDHCNRNNRDRNSWNNNNQQRGDQQGRNRNRNNSRTFNRQPRDYNLQLQQNQKRIPYSQNPNSDKQRSRNKPYKPYNQFDNISIVSNGTQQSKKSRKVSNDHDKSFSLDSSDGDDQKEEIRSQKSFILNQSQLSSSEQITRKLGNLSFENNDEVQKNYEREMQKQDKEHSISFEMNESIVQDNKKNNQKSQIGGFRKKPKKIIKNNSTLQKSNHSISIIQLPDEN